MNKTYSMHILAVEYYSFFKNKETTVFKTIGINLEDNSNSNAIICNSNQARDRKIQHKLTSLI